MTKLVEEEDAGLDAVSLLLETASGDAQLLSAREIKQKLSNSVLMLDLVILQACHSEVVGRVFQQKYAKYVICINNAK